MQKPRPRIEAFRTQLPTFDLEPSPANRQWMDEFSDRHAYRCLPLSIANTHGWDVACPADVEIEWNGKPDKTDLLVRATGPLPDGVVLDDFLRSHFTRGVVTFHTTYMFRTPPGWNILVSGPFNHPKHGIAPLTGIVESDWLPYPFTMNWIMTAPGTVRFAKGEPICTILPIPKNYLGDWEVAVHDLADDPAMGIEHEAFRSARDGFQKRLDAKDPEAIKQAWQKHYFVGRHPDGTMVEGHINKARLAEPIDASGQRPAYAKPDPTPPAVARIAMQMNPARSNLLTGGVLTATPRAALQAETASPAALWRADSPLNGMESAQTDRNRAGRERLRDGLLVDETGVIEVTDSAGLDFLIVRDFLSPERCAALADYARSQDFTKNHKDIRDDYWKSRMLFYGDVRAQRPDLAAIMLDANGDAIERIADFYRLDAPIFADTLQLVRWNEGMHMVPHADRANPDGSTHPFPFRAFASIVYLNDDYDGGEVYFPALDALVKPQAGMLVAFTGGWRHEHGVLKIRHGTRFTMPAFYGFDASKRDRALYDSEPR